MGYFSDYIGKQFTADTLTAERKQQLKVISEETEGADVLVYAANLEAAGVPNSIVYDDLLPIHDQLSNMSGSKVVFILETPGGSGEVAEDIVKLLHQKYEEVSIIIPGWCKSAGTIIAMAADNIFMGEMSALGPIDAQMTWNGKSFSADALLKGLDKIKDEVNDTGALNRAYIPILQNISPGELENAQNALNFAKKLVRDWLIEYKFKNWTVRETSQEAVTEEYKSERADSIATALCDHGRWKTHGKSIKMDDLRDLGLQIIDYREQPKLDEAINRYYTLARMTFDSNIYKLFETIDSQVYKFKVQNVQGPQPLPDNMSSADINFVCDKCKFEKKIQANLAEGVPIKDYCDPYPPDDKYKCTQCGTEHDLSNARRQIEMISKKTVITQ